jgi:hypothetical protein
VLRACQPLSPTKLYKGRPPGTRKALQRFQHTSIGKPVMIIRVVLFLGVNIVLVGLLALPYLTLSQ